MENYLFRGKSEETGEWLYGSLVKNTRGDYAILSGEYFSHEGFDFEYVISNSVCQYTGKTDANNVKVFDGDRLTREGMWPMRVLGIRVVPDDDVQRNNCTHSRCKGIDEFDFSEWEVFGNVYDKE